MLLAGPGLARAVVELARERLVDPVQLAQAFLDLHFLPLQQLDLLEAFLAAQGQRVAVGLVLLGRDHLADFAEREAQLLSLQDQRETGAIAVRIQAIEAVAMRRDQALVLVEAQRAQRHSEFARQFADGERGLARRSVIPGVARRPDTGRRAIPVT